MERFALHEVITKTERSAILCVLIEDEILRCHYAQARSRVPPLHNPLCQAANQPTPTLCTPNSSLVSRIKALTPRPEA